MVNPDDVVKTFMECFNINLSGRSEEEIQKIHTIAQKSMVDLCYILVPEVDVLVSEESMYPPKNDAQAALIKALLNDQRKAYFALVAALFSLKKSVDELQVGKDAKLAEVSAEMKKLTKRISGFISLNNTSAFSKSQIRETPPAEVPKGLVEEKPEPPKKQRLMDRAKESRNVGTQNAI